MTDKTMRMRRCSSIRWRGLLLLLSLTLALSACAGPRRSGDVLRRFALGRIQAYDLPFGWSRSLDYTHDVSGAFGELVTFYGADMDTDSFVNVSQIIYIYDSEAASRADYATRVTDGFPAGVPDLWKPPADLIPPQQADEAQLACKFNTINDIPIWTCVVVARYGSAIMELQGHIFEERWMTVPQFQVVIDRLDAKMALIRAPLDGALTPTP
jgi:hypothetical protein